MGLKDFFKNNDKKVNSYKPIKPTISDDFNKEKVKKVDEVKLPIKKENSLKAEIEKEKTPIISKEDKQEDTSKVEVKDKGARNSFWNINYKETLTKTLFLFLIEDTAEMKKYNDKIHMVYEMIPKDALVCFIHYGDCLYNSGVMKNSLKVRRRICELYGRKIR